MASSSAHVTRRPNRTAAQRREQHLRSQGRAISYLLKMHRSFEHRGAQSPAVLTEHISALAQSAPSEVHTFFAQPPIQRRMKQYVFKMPAGSFSVTSLEQQVSALNAKLDNHISELAQSLSLLAWQGQCLSAQIAELDSTVGIATAQSSRDLSSRGHRIEDLLDSSTLERVRQLQSSTQEASAPRDTNTSVATSSAAASTQSVTLRREQLQKLRVVDIRAILSVLGSQTSGLKDDLVRRLDLYRGDFAQLHALRVDDLHNILRRLDIYISGSKQELTNRLEQYLAGSSEALDD